MQFYTNVTPWGNTLLVREYVNGERVNRKVKYSPTLFCKVIKETNYKTLDGQNVTPIKHETIKEAKEWLKSYEDQPHLVFGNTTFQYNYIADSYPNYVKWDIDKILPYFSKYQSYLQRKEDKMESPCEYFQKEIC